MPDRSSICHAHGLCNVTFDPPRILRSQSQWTEGWAQIDTSLPLLTPVKPSERVRFAWTFDSDLKAKLRRHAQLVAIDTLGGGGRFSAVQDVVAWWEDEDGYWLVTRGTEPSVPLPQWWQGVKGHCEVSFALLSIVEALKSLHNRDLSLIVTRPHAFSMRDGKAFVTRLEDVGCLPTFKQPSGFDPLFVVPFESPVIDDAFIRSNLRYLSPSVADARRVGLVGDIYSFGVLAYELLTQSTIDGGPESPGHDAVDILADIHRHITCDIMSPYEYFEREAELGAVAPDLPPKALSDIIMKCLSRDVEDRYGSLDALAYDLRRLGQICKSGGDLSKFHVGHVDQLSRFRLPPKPVHRSEETGALEQAWRQVSKTDDDHLPAVRVVNVWGTSGSGKTRLVQSWVKEIEMARKGRSCLVAQSKLDEFSQRPISSFVQIFQSLLDRVFTDPTEDPRDWNKRIRVALGQQYSVFLSMLSNEYRRMLLMGEKAPSVEPIDWANFVPAFKGWSKRLLQIFGNISRPLIVVIDDLQWMREDEMDIWRSLLTGPHPVEHVIIITMYRVEGNEPPSKSLLAGTDIHVQSFPESGVAEFIQACLPTTVDSLSTLASFLYAETSGSPLYLRSLMVSLVGAVIFFDYDFLMWRFDPLALQTQLSDAGVDAYLDKVQRGLPVEARRVLQLLACLPVGGCKIELLAQLGEEVETSLVAAQNVGTIIVNGDHVRFSHDRPRSTAYKSITQSEKASLHQRVSDFLAEPCRIDDYVFEAADHALIARSLGADVGAPSLLLLAADRAAISASFDSARRYLDAMRPPPELFMRHLELTAQVYGVLGLYDEVFAKLDAIKPASDLQSLQIDLLRIRQYIAANRHIKAMDLLYRTMASHGYDPMNPPDITLPRTVAEVEALVVPSVVKEIKEDASHVIMSMLGYAGATIFVSELERREATFRLGASLAIATGLNHHAAAYLVSTFGITHSEIPMQEALCRLAVRITALRPGSWLTGNTLVVTTALSHHWLSLEDLPESMTAAFDATFGLGNFELSAYVYVLDMAGRQFAKRPGDKKIIMDRFKGLASYSTPAIKVLTHSPIQYGLKLTEKPIGVPWLLEGSLLSQYDIDQVKALDMHVSLSNTYALRLAVLFDAPLEEQISVIERTWNVWRSSQNLVFGAEWCFLAALVFVQTGDARLQECVDYVAHVATKSLDYTLRLHVIQAYKDIQAGAPSSQVDAVIERLDAESQHILSALLNRRVANALNPKLALGYNLAAYHSFKAGDAPAVCHVMRTTNAIFPPVFNNLPVPPPLRRASISSGSKPEKSETDESLDTLTLMRSSLALASEKDPQLLLCTLLRILCQFARADFAAIGLVDDNDKSMLRLRACGKAGRILPYDVAMDQLGSDVCPSTYMLHTARTGKAMDKSDLARSRPDPFYSKPPRSLLCLPIMNQGVQTGVILLSSFTMTSMDTTGREVVSTLATFATIVTSNYSFTHRLQQEVEQRTKELTQALQAKTQFLSQCSHELRSPLSAVLGLSAVLEASPGLSTVQREHLRTIIASGEDLLGLINNLLDFAKLESHSVELERIPFSLRDLCEGALDIIASIAQKKDIEVCLVSSIARDPPALLGDPFRVKQVLMNLLSNGVKFTSEGRVTVRWEYEEIDDKIKVTLRIDDTGIGIPASKMDKLFRSFSQVDESITRSFGGSGLGLVISRNLAQLLGGDCTASSEYGKGSTFSFSFMCERDQEVKEVKRFPEPQSCFVICQTGPWWDMLQENLEYLNCKPVRFEDDVDKCLELDFPSGLNSKSEFNHIFLDTQLVTTEIMKRMHELQRNAKFIYLVRSIDLASDMKRFQITRESIVARPIKFSSLYTALMQSEGGDAFPELKKAKKRADKTLSKSNPLKILVVDDNNVNILVGRRILGMFGYENIACAMDGQQAIEEAEKQQYDLILLDLQMPVLDGYSAHKRIQASPLAGDPCVVALTANADQETQKKCHEAGFFDYLSKPLDIPKLEGILKHVYKYRKEKDINL